MVSLRVTVPPLNVRFPLNKMFKIWKGIFSVLKHVTKNSWKMYCAKTPAFPLKIYIYPVSFIFEDPSLFTNCYSSSIMVLCNLDMILISITMIKQEKYKYIQVMWTRRPRHFIVKFLYFILDNLCTLCHNTLNMSCLLETRNFWT